VSIYFPVIITLSGVSAEIFQTSFCPQGSPKEVVSVSNMGISKRGPIIETRDQLLLEFTDGSVCVSEGQKLSYTTRIHLVCSRGTIVSELKRVQPVDAYRPPCVCDVTVFVLHTVQSMGPRFLMNQNCTANFMWETRAACAIQTVKNDVSSPACLSQLPFTWNLYTFLRGKD